MLLSVQQRLKQHTNWTLKQIICPKIDIGSYMFPASPSNDPLCIVENNSEFKDKYITLWVNLFETLDFWIAKKNFKTEY